MYIITYILTSYQLSILNNIHTKFLLINIYNNIHAKFLLINVYNNIHTKFLLINVYILTIFILFINY